MKTVKDLRKAHAKAERDREKTFKIDGFEFLTKYAKYLLEYIDMVKVPDEVPLKSIIVEAENG